MTVEARGRRVRRAGLFTPGSVATWRGARALAPVMFALALGVPACRSGPAISGPGSDAGFATGELHILSSGDTVALRVEIASTPRQRRLGLSGRAELPDDEGMLFLFQEEQAPGRSFWMYRTPLPLSIAFLDERWVIGEIRQMRPCGSWISFFCPTYRAGVSFHAALEVNRGYFERRGVRVGDRVVLRWRAPHRSFRPSPELLLSGLRAAAGR